MASSLNHPHLLTVHDAGEFEGHQYLLSELIDGGILKDWARTERSWRERSGSADRRRRRTRYRSQSRITHRDIKPANILVSRNGYAKLADLHWLSLTEPTTPDDSTRTPIPETTRPGMILGTIAYMSPEQVPSIPELVTRRETSVFQFLVGGHVYDPAASRPDSATPAIFPVLDLRKTRLHCRGRSHSKYRARFPARIRPFALFPR